ncbi:hypothetical protein ACOMHN_030521 [Nucella lapillus]
MVVCLMCRDVPCGVCLMCRDVPWWCDVLDGGRDVMASSVTSAPSQLPEGCTQAGEGPCGQQRKRAVDITWALQDNWLITSLDEGQEKTVQASDAKAATATGVTTAATEVGCDSSAPTARPENCNVAVSAENCGPHASFPVLPRVESVSSVSDGNASGNNAWGSQMDGEEMACDCQTSERCSNIASVMGPRPAPLASLYG